MKKGMSPISRGGASADRVSQIGLILFYGRRISGDIRRLNTVTLATARIKLEDSPLPEVGDVIDLALVDTTIYALALIGFTTPKIFSVSAVSGLVSDVYEIAGRPVALVVDDETERCIPLPTNTSTTYATPSATPTRSSTATEAMPISTPTSTGTKTRGEGDDGCTLGANPSHSRHGWHPLGMILLCAGIWGLRMVVARGYKARSFVVARQQVVVESD